MNQDFTKRITEQFNRYYMRVGVSDLYSADLIGGEDIRKISDITWHNKYKPGMLHYDVGIAIASKDIEFTNYIRPLCLPFLPVDNENQFNKEPIIMIGWKR